MCWTFEHFQIFVKGLSANVRPFNLNSELFSQFYISAFHFCFIFWDIKVWKIFNFFDWVIREWIKVHDLSSWLIELMRKCFHLNFFSSSAVLISFICFLIVTNRANDQRPLGGSFVFQCYKPTKESVSWGRSGRSDWSVKWCCGSCWSISTASQDLHKWPWKKPGA